MCGIIGIFNDEKAGQKIKIGLSILKNRGKDGVGITDAKQSYFAKEARGLPNTKSRNILGHSLHSIVGFVKQPLENRFVANCEIYNWNELNKKHKLKAKNDAELILRLLDKKGLDSTKEFEGVYAFAYLKEDELIIARDIIGEKPVWYSHSGGFAFASEKKALEKIGYQDIIELNPRKFLKYNLKEDRLSIIEREFFVIGKPSKESFDKTQKGLQRLLKESIEKRIPERKFGLLFSGGVDSTLIAKILKDLGCDFTCYTAACGEHAEDILYAKEAAKELGLKLRITEVDIKKVPALLKKIVPLIEDSNVTKVAVALPFFVACEQAKKDGCKVIFSGLGSEELFAGYQRHKNSTDINKECLSGLIKIYERDLYRDDVITMYHNIELRLPFLDLRLVDFALKMPVEYKLTNAADKIVLRKAATELGVPQRFSQRKKRAAQYGSNFMKAIEKLTKKAGFEYKSQYMRGFYPGHNLRLGVLFSGGKDSVYAAYVMQRQNYEISCLITIKSKNPDSYMFHTPNIDLAKKQAEAMELELIEKETEGVEEKELTELKAAILEAKEKFGIQGIVTGALFSTYQRNRIEKICDELGLKIFSPLWHINQETEMREILNEGFDFMITKIAADGLDKSWLGRPIAQKDVDKLVQLNKKNGINIAFEGGEAETLVINGPMFKKKLEIKKAEIKMENSYTGIYEIEEIALN